MPRRQHKNALLPPVFRSGYKTPFLPKDTPSARGLRSRPYSDLRSNQRFEVEHPSTKLEDIRSFRRGTGPYFRNSASCPCRGRRRYGPGLAFLVLTKCAWDGGEEEDLRPDILKGLLVK